MTEDLVTTKEELVKRFDNKTVQILGSEYTIRLLGRDKDIRFDEEECDGYCASYDKLICLNLSNLVANPLKFDWLWVKAGQSYVYLSRVKHVLKHEIVHAFLAESGLFDNSLKQKEPWALNEEMIDWMALQTEKIYMAYSSLGLV